MEYIAITLAAGEGKRMNAGDNKQFLAIGGKPLIIHTLDVFQKDTWCKEIILVVNPKEKQRMEQLLNKHSFNKPITLVEGGAFRQNSVFLGLKQIKDPEAIVFIHDGARPFIEIDALHRLAQVTQEKYAALLAVPVTDTIKQRVGSQLHTLDRQTLWAAQTPQAFRFDVIYDAHERAINEDYLGTDDASLVERLGKEVAIVRGSYDNIKLTTPEDLHRADTYLRDKMND
ncbi:2-C-methyl-D-erythritol 4-phosphate cytidylyltransferase [Radiobacillus sp. PE A8.2]|uniref:2-C-methyl-D-erythritol 4-phosphate cytidylyltransferase n=1 Tax=Radiobacillus sp. PE A8.2 TaxID=3380349 RepID=UPI003890B59B